MSLARLFLVELRRVFQARSTWLVVLLTALAPFGGYSWYTPVDGETTTSVLIANPVMTGALAGAVLFGLLALYEMSRVHRSMTAALIETIVSPLAMNAVRLLALMASAAVSVLFAMVLYLSYTVGKMKALFLPELYCRSFLVLMLPSLILGILAAGALHQLTRRVDLSFVLLVVFVLFGLSPWVADEFLLRWVNPLIPVYSDDFSNDRILRMAMYNRVFWLTMLSGCYFASLLCVRRYGKGVLGSLWCNLRYIWIPCLVVLLIGGGYYAYVQQPFIDHSPPDGIAVEEPLVANASLLRTDVDLHLKTSDGTVQGRAIYRLANNNTKPQRCQLSVNPGYKVTAIKANGEALPFTDLANDTNNAKAIRFRLPVARTLTLSVDYEGFPQEWSMSKAYIWGNEVGDHYVLLSGPAFAPVLAVPEAKAGAAIVASITMPAALTCVPSGGPAKLLSSNTDGTKKWMAKDTGTTMTVYAGDYAMQVIDAKQMRVEFFYSRRHTKVMREARAQRVMAEVIDYCTKHYGPLPYDKERPLKLVQTTAYDQGGSAFGNFSVMAEIFFSDAHLKNPNSREGTTSGEVLAHEIIHQWWGLSAPVHDKSPWSSEGLTVYTTYRLVKEKHGSAYARRHYVDKWQKGVDHLQRSFYYRHPEYLDVLPEKYRVRVAGQVEATRMYQEMPLTIMKAAELLGGEGKLDKVLMQLYQGGGTEMPPYITFNDFLHACGLTKDELTSD